MTKARSNATAPNAKGTLVVGNGTDASTTLAVASTAGYLLTVDSGETTGLKWAAAPTSGANWSLLNTGGTSLSGAQTITVSGISGKDKIMVLISGASSVNSESYILVRVNEDAGATSYATFSVYFLSANTYAANNIEGVAEPTTNGITMGRLSGNASSTLSGYALFSGCNASGAKIFNYAGAGNAGGSNAQQAYIGGGYYPSSSTISSISIRSTSGNLDAGTVYVYTSA